ncbi:hypothetical protein [Brevibacillus laterosporus]|uniref:hypothetical protein n=1 Tax=Brevibacillus laterosporus TaxID=1465 RepID=UPI0003B1E82C|nr:hypothetical protein [Brevibacillus laterosporus]ERM16635.1 hypothetical protein P615_22565 [Brevibacillus laterosporus PE36]
MYDGDTVLTYEDKQALQAKGSYVKEKTWLVPWYGNIRIMQRMLLPNIYLSILTSIEIDRLPITPAAPMQCAGF